MLLKEIREFLILQGFQPATESDIFLQATYDLEHNTILYLTFWTHPANNTLLFKAEAIDIRGLKATLVESFWIRSIQDLEFIFDHSSFIKDFCTPMKNIVTHLSYSIVKDQHGESKCEINLV